MKRYRKSGWDTNKTWEREKASQATLFLLLITLILGCNPVMESFTSTPVPSVANTPLSLPSIKTAPQLTPTLTYTLLTTPIGTTAEETPDALQEMLSADCLANFPELPRHTLSGHLILQRINEYFLFDLDTARTTNLDISTSEDYATKFSASRDGKWLVYVVLRGNSQFGVIEPAKSILQQATGQRIEWGKDNFENVIGWLDDQNIIITRRNQPFNSTVILNPWTGTEEVFSLSDVPNSESSIGAQLYFFSDQVNIVPDPSMSMLVYPRRESDGASYVALWDRQSEQLLAKLRDLRPYFGVPLWSPDGENFIISVSTQQSSDSRDWVNVNELFQISTEGQIRQLTHFGRFLTWNRIWKTSRSPDGRYLVFQVDYHSGDQTLSKYLVMNLSTGSIAPTCFNSSETWGSVSPPNSVVWSPDSQFFALYKLDQQGHGWVILGNPKTGQSYRVKDNMSPAGWLVDP